MDQPIKRLLPVIPPPTDHPKLVAERLLKSVLPDELYIHLVAMGEFKCTINDHTYTFSRTTKTIVEMKGKRYSCCIELTDTQAPRADRIVAEYLLALNDEDKYLKTANLTEVLGWNIQGWDLELPRFRGREINRLWLDESRFDNDAADATRYAMAQMNARMEAAMMAPHPPTVDPPIVAIDRAVEAQETFRDLGPSYICYNPQDGPPPTIRPRTAPISELHISQIANECLNQITRHERIQGMRYRRQHYGTCHQPEVIRIEQQVAMEQLGHRTNNSREAFDIIYRHLMPIMVEDFVRALTGFTQYGVYEVHPGQIFHHRPEPESFAIVRDDHRTGLIIYLAKSCNQVQRTMDFTLAIGVDRAI